LYFPVVIKETYPSVPDIALSAGRKYGTVSAETFDGILAV
jgi:hypothetical protein